MDILKLGAAALSQLIHHHKLTCIELMEATLQRIDQVNPKINAIVNLRDAGNLLKEAKTHDVLLKQGTSKGWLHGIPQAIKDLSPAAGIANTMGSPLLTNFIPKEDGLMTQRMRAAGAIVIGKTNVPEFGLGSHTFNPVFGATHNPYDASKTSGGSSGGAAAALATGMLSVADGSDFMGSLRNPAAWCNVFGLRPSQGRVPMWPATDVWINQLGTEGPMARDVASLRKLLWTQSGSFQSTPLSIAACAYSAGENAQIDIKKPLKNAKIGYLGDLGGYLATENGILEACEAGLKRLETQGAFIKPVTGQAFSMPYEQIWQAWLIWRQALVGSRLAPFLTNPQNRSQMKPEALWEYDMAQNLKGAELMQASAVRSSFYQGILRLFEEFDFLALPTTQVWPFAIEQHHPTEIHTSSGARQMDTYHRWMECTIYATFAGLPAISMPCGFNQSGLPAGIQIIGKLQAEDALLDLAQAYEGQIGDWLSNRPCV